MNELKWAGVERVLTANGFALVGSLTLGSFFYYLGENATSGAGSFHVIIGSFFVPMLFMLVVPWFYYWKRNDFYFFEKDIVQVHLGRLASIEAVQWNKTLTEAFMRPHSEDLMALHHRVKSSEGAYGLAIRGEALAEMARECEVLAHKIWNSTQVLPNIWPPYPEPLA